ncbi:MAG: hypothetical protein HKO66_00110 [Saprospiraceae bacterium]|nr:site-2 protease family protein [Bacteroidia bacterium]NNE14832.1 hypothetical protein [Saprospiraceae bacterium]NNL90609.1 hypothetical protein [Saprospiraceae bacterium]
MSVLLHEFGHAIVAKKLGIIPKDIIISALGGLSRLNTMKEHPRKEIIIAFAGPFLNLVIAIIAFLYVIIFTDQYFQISSLDTFLFTDYFGIPFKIAAINLILFLFNLVPAFPMDGGRILRGLFSLKFGYKKATVLASTIGRFIALGFFIIGAINRFYILIFLSGLIYIMAAREGFIHKKRAQ